DAKPRRESFEPEDLFYAHIAGMDTFARGLKVAAKLKEDQVFENIIGERYNSFNEGIGLAIIEGKADFHTLEAYALQNKPIVNQSGRQEKIKGILNQYLLEV
ncbi:MAG: Xylose isomerase, partial [Firmicutes bacterium]|nr:Xylose isomerase [Bacillota bacterium]